ncbi:MAG TPA: TRAP transporter substrate-binding protein DctP [Acetobacteraceae bacterium]|nr:TRAP transporter substrate-binding protein DctP [Acetobacteraceae bacterium]
MSRTIARALCAVALLLSTTAAHAATTWECYVYNPVATQAAVQAMIHLADTVKQKTNGDLLINIHLGGSLPIKADNITAAVADSVVQIGDDGFATGSIPITGVLRLPMLLQSYDELDKAMAILRPHLDTDYGKRGIVVLGQYSYPFQVIWGRKKITSLADIKGMKLRVTSVEQGEFIRRFGGVSLTMGSPDVAAALDRGVVEGALTASSGGGLLWHDLLKYRYGFPTSYVNSTIIVNRDAFEKLPATTQKILRDTAAEQAAWATAEMKKQEDEITARFGKEGMVLTPATADDIKLATEKMRSYWDSWAKAHGPEAVAVLAQIRAAVGR